MAAQLGIRNLIGHRLLDRDGNSVGKIGQVFFDDQTDLPKWVTVRSGLFGTRENFVPLRGAQVVDDDLQVPYMKAMIKEAPSFRVDQHISMQQEDIVYRHYGLDPEVPDPREPEPVWRPKGKHARRTDAEPNPGYGGGEAAHGGYQERARGAESAGDGREAAHGGYQERPRGAEPPWSGGEAACRGYAEPSRTVQPQRRGYQQTPNVRKVSYPGYNPGPHGGDVA
ncbi:PRC-barrel domain-containing protein [Nocardiopsis rhodophaea]|uniref:PRC-barrel domain-containing protein n=1 Tax=Nocardiopsis rhodophaea TaxID=280238 RepID=UPI0031D02235